MTTDQKAVAGTQAVNRVPKPWGYEVHWAHTDRYVGKILHVTAGHALSLQFHNVKDEAWYSWIFLRLHDRMGMLHWCQPIISRRPRPD